MKVQKMTHGSSKDIKELIILSPLYQMIVITIASLFPVAAIVYSLNYAITNKKRVRNIDSRIR